MTAALRAQSGVSARASPPRWRAWTRIPATPSPQPCISPWPAPGSCPGASSTSPPRWSSPPPPPPSATPPSCSPPPVSADSASRSWSSASASPPGSWSVSSPTFPSGRPPSRRTPWTSWPSSAPGPGAEPWGKPGTSPGCRSGSSGHSGGTGASGPPGTAASPRGQDSDLESPPRGPSEVKTHNSFFRCNVVSQMWPPRVSQMT